MSVEFHIDRMYCTTAEISFGPSFKHTQEWWGFMRWLEHYHPDREVRQLSEAELMQKLMLYRRYARRRNLKGTLRFVFWAAMTLGALLAAWMMAFVWLGSFW